MNEILLSYELPSSHKILLSPKKNWKPITHTKIDNFWKNKWSEDAKTKSTLSYMETNTWKYKQPNLCWSSFRDNKRDVKKRVIQSRVLTTGARGTDLPPPFFSNFLFTNVFSIKFLYFFIISSLFPYFNLFVSIFIQSYVNINCMCRPY